MKNYLTKFCLLTFGAILIGFTATAQSGNDGKVFEGIDNPESYSTLDLLHMDRQVSTFSDLVALANLEVSLTLADSPHTLFVPTNEAFADMTIEEFAELTDPKNRTKLINFVKRHYMPKKVMKRDFKDADIMDTEGEEEIRVSTTGNTVSIGGAQIVEPDIKTSDGVIQIMDNVLQPTGDIMN
ncbi:fasciclin domain-containing protein [Pricia sp. S334]|uniref:Fasciclin domain-containing protein n=1 Tax=Pricia mediterranea TaxID=3076079 RepID=A0ABU3L2Q8_9FLAO|nr:fasciclin domain-containing protein [Pricia sp. S334]MDT7827581.1 fasciclin domain-containing protein [Pricia sp. S334]